MKLMNAKGTRDFPLEEEILRQKIISILKKNFELFGFSPLETPVLERFDVLSAKYAGGSEILKESFKLKDQGNRQLGLRYDLTVPFARFIGMNPQLKTPLKRYQLGPVFRDGPIKMGRYREFWQCDADVVGVKSIKADVEVLQLASNVFKDLNLNINIEFNSRKLLNAMLKGIKNKEEVMLSLDKLKKAGMNGVKKELRQKGLKDSEIKSLLKLFSLKGTNYQKLKKLKKALKNNECLEEIEEILRLSPRLNLVFNPFLARGLSYYTGPIYEVFLKNSPITSSIAGGGRYDNLIKEFLNSKQEFPTTGISFGLDVIFEEIKRKEKLEKKTVTKVYIIPIKTAEESLRIAQKLRTSGINTDIDLNSRGISKNLDYANRLNIPYVVFVGPEELKRKKLKLRNMSTGKESFLTLPQLTKKV